MMAGEKPGGHGERCVAVGTLDMAIWDAAAKIAGLRSTASWPPRAWGREPEADASRSTPAAAITIPADDRGRLATSALASSTRAHPRQDQDRRAAPSTEDLRAHRGVLGASCDARSSWRSTR